MRRPDANSVSVSLPPVEALEGEIRRYLERTRERFELDFDPVMGRVIGAIPEIWWGEASVSKVALGPGQLDSATKELIATCASAMNVCEY